VTDKYAKPMRKTCREIAVWLHVLAITFDVTTASCHVLGVFCRFETGGGLFLSKVHYKVCFEVVEFLMVCWGSVLVRSCFSMACVIAFEVFLVADKVLGVCGWL